MIQPESWIILLNKMNRILLYFLFGFLISCKSDYDRLVRNELSSGVRNDSLIFDIYMGDTRKEFYAKCWELNSKKIISQGTGNQSVKYIEPEDSLGDKSLRKEMLFYATFDEKNIIRGMEMVYNFTAWAPWNKTRHSDTLLEELKKEFEKDFGGNEFIQVDLHDINYKAYVKVDGNRQIVMYPLSSKDVKVKIEDLNFKQKTS